MKKPILIASIGLVLTSMPAIAADDFEARCKEWAWEYAIADDKVAQYIQDCIKEQQEAPPEADNETTEFDMETLDSDLEDKQ